MKRAVPWALLLAVASAGGGQASGRAFAAGGTPCSAPAQRRAATAASFAAGRYRLEASGAAVHAALARVVADRVLRDAIRAGNLATAKAEALRQVRGNQHITAIQVLRGKQVLLQTSLYPFDVAGARSPLRDLRGRELATVAVTIQDVIGFIRLVHKFTGTEVVVRGAGGEAKSSLPVAPGVRIPTVGCLTLRGRAYAVRSIAEISFVGETLAVSVLAR